MYSPFGWPRGRVFFALSSVFFLSACSGNPSPGDGSASRCSSAPYGDRVAIDHLAGTYRLVLEASHGSRSGRMTAGELRLVPFLEEEVELPSWAAGPHVRIVFYGATDIVLGEVGALADGSRRSMDPEEAGVLAIEQRTEAPQGWKVTIRLGSRSNRFHKPPIEGPYMALAVSELCKDSFSGTWSSGRLTEEAGGTFSAQRVPE